MGDEDVHDYVEKYGRPLHPEQLKHHKCLCYSNLKQPTRWQYRDPQGIPLSIDVNSTLLCNSSEMELAMVLDGHGICRLPTFTMQSALDSNQLTVLFEDFIDNDIDVFVVYPSRKHLSPKVRKFIDLMVERL